MSHPFKIFLLYRNLQEKLFSTITLWYCHDNPQIIKKTKMIPHELSTLQVYTVQSSVTRTTNVVSRLTPHSYPTHALLTPHSRLLDYSCPTHSLLTLHSCPHSIRAKYWNSDSDSPQDAYFPWTGAGPQFFLVPYIILYSPHLHTSWGVQNQPVQGLFMTHKLGLVHKLGVT